jgi:hypothetical protein
MYARVLDDAAVRLRTLRHEQWEDLTLAALALGLAIAASKTRSGLAVPLLLGGLAVGALGVRAAWRRWDLIERLADDAAAHVIPEVKGYASQQATMERRQSFAALIRSRLPRPGIMAEARVAAVADELTALAVELEDDALELDLASAVTCMRLLSDVETSPLLNASLPPEDLRACVRRIRSGFAPAKPLA